MKVNGGLVSLLLSNDMNQEVSKKTSSSTELAGCINPRRCSNQIRPQCGYCSLSDPRIA